MSLTLKELAEQCVADSEKYFGDVAYGAVVHSIPHHTLALAGEVGELANIVKKVERQTLDFQEAYDAMAMECVDVMIYLMNIVGLMGLNIEEAYKIKREYNAKRFAEEREARNG